MDYPFTFSGDSAFIAIPGTFKSDIQEIVESCQLIVQDRFQLDLAAGLVSVEEIYTKGFTLKVAKFKTSEHVSQAAFWGEGVAEAERIVKRKKMPAVSAYRKIQPDFTGLECRWNQFPARQEAIAIIIESVETASEKQS